MVSRVVDPLGPLVLVGALLWPAAAGADEAKRVSDAAEAYDIAVALHAKHDYPRAARFFARADEIAPSDVALTEALRSALLADDAPLGMELVDRSRRVSVQDAALAQALRAARARFANRVGSVSIDCVPKGECEADVDGADVPKSGNVWLVPGTHVVRFRHGASVQERTVDVAPGASILIATSSVGEGATATHGGARPEQLSAPPPANVEAPRPTGLSPVWFWAAAAVTGALAATSAISEGDVLGKHASFEHDRSNADLAASGLAAQRRTNVLFVVTGVAAAATAALGIFAVNWSGARDARATSGGRLVPTLRAAIDVSPRAPFASAELGLSF